MPDKPSISRRERHVAARLEQILKAAARLFAAKGFHRTTTREIAEAADISEGTLYNYFESKDDLLFGIVARLAEAQGIDSWSISPVPGGAREYFSAMLNFRRDYADQNAAMLQAVFSEILANSELGEHYYHQLVEPTLTALEKQIQLRVELGQIRPIDAPMTARILAGLLTGLFVFQVLGDDLVQSEWHALSDVITTIIFEGLEPN